MRSRPLTTRGLSHSAARGWARLIACCASSFLALRASARRARPLSPLPLHPPSPSPLPAPCTLALTRTLALTLALLLTLTLPLALTLTLTLTQVGGVEQLLVYGGIDGAGRVSDLCVP